jgi:futalosine hydrolase
MILAIAATQMELDPFLVRTGEPSNRWMALAAGVGPVETAVTAGRFLAEHHAEITGVLQFGIGGVYIVPDPEDQVGILSVCIADREIIGDFGICHQDSIEYFPAELGGASSFPLTSPLIVRAEDVLKAYGITYHVGTFVTVNSVSGTARRGEMLRNRWQGLCENMEGGAVARLCKEYNLPLLEMRVISNVVEDRNIHNWQLRQACDRAGEVAAVLIKELS